MMTETTLTGSAMRTADPTVAFRRVTTAVLLPLAFTAQLVCNTLYAVASTGNAGDTGSGAQSLQFYAAHADAMVVATLAALIGCLLAVPGLLAALRVIRPAKPRLGLWAVGLMIAGYVSYFGITMTGFDALALARLAPQAGAVLDAAQSDPAAVPFFLLFVAGNLVGTALLGVAVLLTRRLPWWAGALILGWPVGHLANILGGGEWFAVAGGALEVAGLCVLAAHALRTSDAEWAAGG